MKRTKKIVSPISLREVYQYRGEFSAKMIIDPAVSPDIDDVVVEMRNSDGKPMDFSFRRWGTKLTVSFVIDSSTPDGVSVIDVLMSKKGSSTVRERLDFWVIKD